MQETIHKVAIIGTGPAGLTAAIYAARARLDPVVIEGSNPGGQLMITTEVENYPGFRDGIMGPALMQEMREQALRFGTTTIPASVTGVHFSGWPFRLTTDSAGEILSHAVIVATGASARLLNIPSETALMGHGVSACATCDGFFFRDVNVAVVGGGDTAMEEALFLTKFASKVTVIHRRDELRASRFMQERAFANEKIEFVWNSVVEEVHDQAAGKVTGLTLRNVLTEEKAFLPVGGLFIAIGHSPNTAAFAGHLDMNPVGYLLVTGVRTSVEGVFAAGDVADFTYRQAITAAGTGCAAAIDAERWLAAKGIE